uniref:DnaB/C C-terminal domain-containing protein n=1 Tax=uncultured Bacillota bacterium TaxID=344338 RepID=A0A650EMV7_9FIRM|nr:hypothetical protein Firmicute1046_2630 [uncultured Firmicutes bacterium]
MATGFELSFAFVERFGKFAKAEYLQIYICLLGKFRKSGTLLTLDEIEKDLHVKRSVADAAMDYWITCGQMEALADGRFGFVEQETPEESAPPQKREKAQNTTASPAARAKFRPSYNMEEIDAAIAANHDIDCLFKQAEVILNKMLTKADIEMLYSFHEWLGLPVEVITMLLTYGASHDKKGRRYLETVALDWADQGIDTYEKAEEYISKLEESDSKERKIRSVLGIYDRAMTSTEKKYIKQWTQEKDVPIDLIAPAYDRTVERTGKLSWAYMNKILMSWLDEGILTPEALQAKEDAFKQEHSFAVNVPKTPKSKFNNYTDPNKIDYDSINRKILEDLLDD